jgi:hypothetical protein
MLVSASTYTRVVFAISAVDSLDVALRCVTLRELYHDLSSTYLFNVRVFQYYAI